MDWSTKQSLGIDNLYMADIELQSNGQILLAGQFVWYVDYYLDQTSFAVLRLNPDGSLDSSYGDRGTAISEFVIDPVSNHPIISEARALVLQDEDKVLLAGMAYSVLQSSNVTDINIAMVRFDTSGDIDSEFGVSGHVVTNVKGGPTDDFVNAVTTIQGDGKIVTATASYGVHGYDFAVTRHQPDGSLDTSFNDIGWVKTDIRSERIIVEDPWYGTSMQTTISDDYPMALAVQGDGKIVVAGTSVKYVTYNEREALYVVVRYNVDGSLDSTFGDNGVVIQEGLGTQPGYYQHSPANYLADMVLQEDGKIVVTGNGWFDQTPPAPGFDFITIRYNSDGTRDASFGNDGVVITNGHTIKKNDYASSILLQPDGKILIGGSFTGYYGSPANSIAMIRYNSNGTLDSSFDTDGKVSLAMDRSLYNGWDDFSLNDIALQADGSIVVGGRLCRNDWCYFLLTKFNPDGSQDTDFGYDGYGYSLISYNANYSVIYLNQIAVQSDGRILVAGEIIHMVRTIGADQTLGRPPGFKNYTAHDMIVMRLLANGTIDYSFGELGGTVITDFADTDDAAFAITIQPDGKIIAAGTTWATTSNYFTEGHFDMAMARFEGLNTPLDELEGLVFEIQKLATQNVLNQGQAKSLSKILEAAIMQIDGDKYIAAISQLESFNKSVDTFVKTGVLSEELANKLKRWQMTC